MGTDETQIFEKGIMSRNQKFLSVFNLCFICG